LANQNSKGPLKGRGAVNNLPGRFHVEESEAFDDGWSTLEMDDQPAPKTQVFADLTRNILSRNQSPDIPFDQSINPYKGCEHGCIYCYARQTHAYLDLSPGLDFETKIFKKTNAGQLLEEALRKPSYQCKPIALGANTDPYQPIEKEHRVTREILEVLAEYHHPVAIVTKSALVLRDLDLLAPMAAAGLAKVFVSITTLDVKLSRKLEPRTAAPHRRLEVIQSLVQHQIPTGVLAAPMIPALNDMEMENILKAAAKAGALTAGYILVRLPHEVKELFRDWLEAHYPDKARHVMSLIQQSRGGKDYEAGYGKRMRGTGEYAQMLGKRFSLAIKRYGLTRRSPSLNTEKFRPPPRAGDQMDLFTS